MWDFAEEGIPKQRPGRPVTGISCLFLYRQGQKAERWQGTNWRREGYYKWKTEGHRYGKEVSSKKTIAETTPENQGRVLKDLASCPVALDKLLVAHKLRDTWFLFKIWWEHIEEESEVKRFEMSY